MNRIQTNSMEETAREVKNLLGVETASENKDQQGIGLVVEAAKLAPTYVLARQVTEPETGSTYNRKGEFEQDYTAEPGQWIITAADADANPLLSKDGSGKTNTWPISDDTFRAKYDVDHMQNGLAASKPVPGVFVCLDAGGDIYQSWGTVEHMAPGSWLNATNLDKGKAYAIDPVFFQENYTISQTFGRSVDGAGIAPMHTPEDGFSVTDAWEKTKAASFESAHTGVEEEASNELGFDITD